MEPALIMSAASALACASASGAIPPYGNLHLPNTVPSIRIVPPVIALSALPVEIEPELEKLIYTSMSRDFERRYAL